MERHHAYERTAARPFKHNVLLQEHGVKRMRVQVQRQWLLQYPDGRVGLFVINPKGPPLFVPVLRVIREREAWMNMRLTRRGAAGKDQPNMHSSVSTRTHLTPLLSPLPHYCTTRHFTGKDQPNMQVGGRINPNAGLSAEYELVRTDGKVLLPEDIVQEPLALHDEIGKLKRAARKKRIDPTGELQGFVQRLPRKYHSVGVRVYNPSKPKWKLQVVWTIMLGTRIL